MSQNSKAHICEQVIVTSYLFPDTKFSLDRLESVMKVLRGDSAKLVIDLSCRKVEDKWVVAMNKWQTLTDMEVNQGSRINISQFNYT